MNECIAVVAPDPTALRELRTPCPGGNPIRLEATIQSALDAARHSRVRAIVCSLDHVASQQLRDLALDGRVPSVPLILRCSIRQHTGHRLLAVLSAIPMAVVSVEGVHVLAHDIESSLAGDSRGAPHLSLLRAALPWLSTSARTVITAAILTDGRRTSVEALGDLCGLSRRTVEWQTAVAGIPQPRCLLAWMVVLHTSWRMSVLRLSVKQSAHAAGFRTAASFSNYILRNCGVTPMQLVRTVDFETLLTSFTESLSSSRQHAAEAHDTRKRGSPAAAGLERGAVVRESRHASASCVWQPVDYARPWPH